MSPIQTQFASVERADFMDIVKQNHYFSEFGLLCQILDSVQHGVTILNQQRQIVYINQAMVDAAGLSDKEEALGLRVGEAIGCQHAYETEGGCGTTEFCRSCGAVKAILIAQTGRANVQECRITREATSPFDSLDLRVAATPLGANGDELTVFSVTDIADEKRRQVLERIFFHDLRNTATVINGAAEILNGQLGDEDPVSQMLNWASTKLIDEIDAQQQLLAAENGRLQLNFTGVLSVPLLAQLAAMYRVLAQDKKCQVQVALDADNFIMVTDEAVLSRVLSNMIKNALEACRTGETVTVGCRQENDEAHFWVHNPAYMPPKVQRQIFLRSFSTKGNQRGLGTYSMRLLSERYLDGHIGFTSDEVSGTTFEVSYPLRLSELNVQRPVGEVLVF